MGEFKLGVWRGAGSLRDRNVFCSRESSVAIENGMFLNSIR